MKMYYELKENSAHATHLKCELYYSLGGMNYFTGKREGRGYYASVVPVERKSYGNGMMMEGYMAFTGTKMLLKEVSRKSAKAEAEAEKIAEDAFNRLIEYVLNENGLELAVTSVDVPKVEETVA